MIRVGLLDTTIRDVQGSMPRYRDLIVDAVREFCGDELSVTTEYLGCDKATLDRTPGRLRMWRHHLHVWRAAKKLDCRRYDLVHLLDGSFGYAADLVQSERVVVTVHDLIPRLQIDGAFPGAPAVGRGARWLIDRGLSAIRNADRACAVSENTGKDLKRYQAVPPGGVDVIPLAVDAQHFAGPAQSPCDVDIDGPFLLHLGNNGFYKNRPGAIEVFKRLDPSLNMHLVLAGPGPDEHLQQLQQDSGLAKRIVFVTDPDQELLTKLYRAATAFLFPSRYEGFGWPPLEAMAAGCPVVASDAGSIPEVIGTAGIIAPAADYDAMARGCQRLITDESFRAQTIAAGHERIKGFTKQRLADKMRAFYRAASQAANSEMDH